MTKINKKYIRDFFKEKVYKIETDKEKIIMNGKYVFKRNEYDFGFNFDFRSKSYYVDDLRIYKFMTTEYKDYEYMCLSFKKSWALGEFFDQKARIILNF